MPPEEALLDAPETRYSTRRITQVDSDTSVDSIWTDEPLQQIGQYATNEIPPR